MNYTQMYWTLSILLIAVLLLIVTRFATSDQMKLRRFRKKYGVHSEGSAEMQSDAHIWCAKQSYNQTMYTHHMKAAHELKAYAKLLGESK